ncbi:uncharacterized protein LOC111633063 isoform X2 [Centruroides sculpturatus]|uniref:uncharacterized protein LOC111633063 isoform X2 n=1 Tax=Centruroides sculpturatus TaxID=218467 RepID=UPI000C6DEBE5|nr:uncharacterized protein LOC111633063 isoform X2 [Centruroides sculpturatus]
MRLQTFRDNFSNRLVEDKMAAPCKTGYLDVKIQHKSRGLKNWKTWKKRWVVISSTDLRLMGPPSLVIQIYSNDGQKDKNCLFSKSFSSKLSVVYRSRSRTHRHAFSMAEDGGAVLHLAGGSESHSQDWMAAIRDLLWPPSPLLQLKMAYKGSYDVSLIDNEFSYQSGMLGLYGHFMATADRLVLSTPDTGRVVKEWKLCHVKRYQLVPQINKEDAYKVFSLTISEPGGFAGQLQFYSVNSMSILQKVNRALDCYEPVDSLLDTPVEEVDLIQFDDYRRHPGATTDDELEENRHSLGSSGSGSTDTSESTTSTRLFLLPDNMLNCSVNSGRMQQQDEDSDSFSPPSSPSLHEDLSNFDFPSPELDNADNPHIYVDIQAYDEESPKEYIYEELEESEDSTGKETVPPLPPRNTYLHLQNTLPDKHISALSRIKRAKISKLFHKNERRTQSASSAECNEITKENLVRTESLPIFVPSKSHYAPSPLSISAPETLSGFCNPMQHTCDETNADETSHGTNFRGRSKTTPSGASELHTIIAELDKVQSKHRHFRQCMKALSTENLIKQELSLPLSQCIEDLRRFSSEYCNMNADPVYIDMNGINGVDTQTEES